MEEETLEVENQPVYISIEGIFGCLSPNSDTENDGPTEKKRGRRGESSRKQKGSYYDDPDWEYADAEAKSDEEMDETPAPSNLTQHVDNVSMLEEGDGQLVALSKKQLNRLAAMDIYPIPSGGIGTVNASLFNPITVKWLMKNFETIEGSSLPRFLVYNHYLLHCKSLNINPINAASFGKVIRSVFLGLQTRRLGTRGNSKYHYCGMRIKPDSPLLNISVSECENRKTKGNTRGKNNGKSAATLSSSSWTLKRFEEWWTTFTLDLSEDFKILHAKTLQDVMTPLESSFNTNILYYSIQRMLKDEGKMSALLSALNEINFEQVDNQISWVNNDNKSPDGEKLKNILSQPDQLQILVLWIEDIVEEKLSSSLSVAEVKVKLQEVLLDMSYYMTYVRKELIFINKDSFGTFSCMQNFVLEYLKHFTHMRIGMHVKLSKD